MPLLAKIWRTHLIRWTIISTKNQKIGLFKGDCVDALHRMVKDCQFFQSSFIFSEYVFDIFRSA